MGTYGHLIRFVAFRFFRVLKPGASTKGSSETKRRLYLALCKATLPPPISTTVQRPWRPTKSWGTISLTIYKTYQKYITPPPDTPPKKKGVELSWIFLSKSHLRVLFEHLNFSMVNINYENSLIFFGDHTCGNDSFIISPESCYSFLWGFLSKYKGVIPNEPRKKKNWRSHEILVV